MNFFSSHLEVRNAISDISEREESIDSKREGGYKKGGKGLSAIIRSTPAYIHVYIYIGHEFSDSWRDILSRTNTPMGSE